MADRETTREDHERHTREHGGFSSRHASTFVEFGDGKSGWVEIEMCVTCGLIVMARCLHEKNSWNKEGTALTCGLCGKDGT